MLVGASEVWGRTPTEWTAIGTIALTIVAALSFVVSLFIAWKAAKSATAAELAALAANESVGTLLATLEVEFEINLVLNDPMAPAAVRLTWHRPIATLHHVSLDSADVDGQLAVAIPDEGIGPFYCESTEPPGRTLPRRVFPGETLYFMWPADVTPPAQRVGINKWDVTYSFSETGEQLVERVSARNITFRPWPTGHQDPESHGEAAT